MMEQQVFVDTCAWHALFDDDDQNHRLAQRFFSNLQFPLITSNYIFDEALTLIRSRLGHKAAIKFGEMIIDRETAVLERVALEDEKFAWRIFRRYDDKAFSFTDCTSFALMDRLDIMMVFTFDQHFEQYGKFIYLPQEYWTLHEDTAIYKIHPSAALAL